jgi:phage shock protein A
MQRQADADAQYQSAQDQLDAYQESLNDLKAQQEDLKVQVTEATTQIDTLNSTLDQFKFQQTMVTDISQQLKNVILHLATIFSKSTGIFS